ncbi:Uncharacterised protein [Bacillus freudenreichii]|nr:Uncharacterised protein [Bacillus freudenreichii]
MINKNFKIKTVIQSTLTAVGMDVEIQEELSGINMSYNFILHYIGYDVIRIKSAIKEVPDAISLEDYLKTFTLHELGHAIDRESLLGSLDRTIEIYKMKQKHSIEEKHHDMDLLSMLIEEHQMNIVFEKTAWRNAEKLNSKYGLVDWLTFNFLRNMGLNTYIETYEKDLLLLDNLMNHESGQIA